MQSGNMNSLVIAIKPVPRCARLSVGILAISLSAACSMDSRGLSPITANTVNADGSLDNIDWKDAGGVGGSAVSTPAPLPDGGTPIVTSTGGGGMGLPDVTTGGAGGAPGTGGTAAESGGATWGTGGAFGTGGMVASGGVSGTGGAITGSGGTSAGAGGSTGGAPRDVPGVAVKYTCTDPKLREAIAFKLRLVNKTDRAIPLASVKVRYWLAFASPANLVLWCDYAAIQFPRGNCADILGTSTFKVVTPPRSGANTYLEIGFSAAAGSLDPQRSDSNDGMMFRISDSRNLAIDQSDDYSCDCSNPDTEIDSPRITAYVGGALTFGREPP